MAIEYISTSDFFIGANHPVYPDVANKTARYIDTQIGVEHDATTGRHTAQAAALVIENHTHVGTGLMHTFDLQNTTLLPKMALIWSDSANYPVLWVDTMPTHYSAMMSTSSSFTPMSTGIRGAATGSLDLGASTLVNTLGTTYGYLVFGIEPTATYSGGTAGTDPTWIAEGDSGLGGSSSAPLNQTAAHIETAFLAEHADAGTHTTDPYSGQAMIETGAYKGDAEENRVLEITTGFDPTILYLMQFGRTLESLTWWGAQLAIFTSANAANSCVIGLATASFQVGESCNFQSTSSDYYYYWCAIGTH